MASFKLYTTMDNRTFKTINGNINEISHAFLSRYDALKRYLVMEDCGTTTLLCSMDANDYGAIIIEKDYVQVGEVVIAQGFFQCPTKEIGKIYTNTLFKNSFDAEIEFVVVAEGKVMITNVESKRLY